MTHDLFRYLPVDHDSGLGIPYEPKDGSRGVMQYFDLKKNLDLIPAVRELRNRPELQNFISELNKASSVFRTLRCEARCTCNPSNANAWQTHWHVTFAFEKLAQNRAVNYDALNAILESSVRRGQKGHNIAFDIRKIQTSYRDHGVTLWSEDVEVYGMGTTEALSETEFIYGLRLLRNFFYAESKKWFGEIFKGRETTIS